MKEKNRKVTKVLKQFYKDMGLIKLIEKNIGYLRENISNEIKISELQEKVKAIKLKGLNPNILVALDELSDREKEFLENKFGKKKSTLELMTIFQCRETNLWRIENSIYSFMYDYLSQISDENLHIKKNEEIRDEKYMEENKEESRKKCEIS